LRPACCFYFSLNSVYEFDTFLVQYSHLATFNVEEVARHLEALPRVHENFAEETQWDGIRSIYSKTLMWSPIVAVRCIVDSIVSVQTVSWPNEL
jgi:hypothetical protein